MFAYNTYQTSFVCAFVSHTPTRTMNDHDDNDEAFAHIKAASSFACRCEGDAVHFGPTSLLLRLLLLRLHHHIRTHPSDIFTTMRALARAACPAPVKKATSLHSAGNTVAQQGEALRGRWCRNFADAVRFTKPR